MLSVIFYLSETDVNLRCLFFFRNELYFHSLIWTWIVNQWKNGASIRVILSPAYKNQQSLFNTPIPFYMACYTHCTNMYLYNTSTYVVSYFWTINYWHQWQSLLQHVCSMIIAETEARPIHKHARGRSRPLIVVTSSPCDVNQLYDHVSQRSSVRSGNAGS